MDTSRSAMAIPEGNAPIGIYVYSDASLGNRENSATQGGNAIFIGAYHNLQKKNIDVNLISWTSRKLRRVCRSTFASELLSLADAIDKGIALKNLLDELYPGRVKITFILDCMSIVANIFALNSQCTEQRLKIDLASIKEAITQCDGEVMHCAGKHNTSDCLTKSQKFNTAMAEAIETNTIDTSTFVKTNIEPI